MNDRRNFLVKQFGLRGVAVFEAGKGLLALVLGFGMLTLRHKNFQDIAGQLLGFLHISPGRRFSQTLLREAGHLTNHRVWLFFFGFAVYSLIRFVEAAGLWLEKEWAEWFALLSGAMYMPWEIYELLRRADKLRWAIFLANVLIVLYMLWLLLTGYRSKKQKQVETGVGT